MLAIGFVVYIYIFITCVYSRELFVVSVCVRVNLTTPQNQVYAMVYFWCGPACLQPIQINGLKSHCTWITCEFLYDSWCVLALKPEYRAFVLIVENG